MMMLASLSIIYLFIYQLYYTAEHELEQPKHIEALRMVITSQVVMKSSGRGRTGELFEPAVCFCVHLSLQWQPDD